MAGGDTGLRTTEREFRSRDKEVEEQEEAEKSELKLELAATSDHKTSREGGCC